MKKKGGGTRQTIKQQQQKSESKQNKREYLKGYKIGINKRKTTTITTKTQRAKRMRWTRGKTTTTKAQRVKKEKKKGGVVKCRSP